MSRRRMACMRSAPRQSLAGVTERDGVCDRAAVHAEVLGDADVAHTTHHAGRDPARGGFVIGSSLSAPATWTES